MAGPAGDYHRGEMDIHEQVSTYEGFLSLSKWLSLVMAGALAFLVLMFCTKAGFLGSAITGIVVLAVGFLALRSKPSAGH